MVKKDKEQDSHVESNTIDTTAAVAVIEAATDASKVAAEWRRALIYDLFGKRNSYLNTSIMPVRNNVSDGPECSHNQRQIHNSLLLDMTLENIREMDPPFLQAVCHAIRDQVSASLPK